MPKFIVALDLGTTGNRAIAFDKSGAIAASSYKEFPQYFPKPGWVEHNPEEIWQTAVEVLKAVLEKIGADNVTAMGITNQRETTILWHKKTGNPVYNAIVWQCRRTAPECMQLMAYKEEIKEKTGLFTDPYFSGTKIKWILDHVAGVRAEAEKGNILFGTVDTWILWRLTGGKVHATEPSNASRTLIFNIRTLTFDPELLLRLNIPESILPEIKPSDARFGETDPAITGTAIPVTGMLGDQQAALFAQGGWNEKVLKNTYGTGLFVVAGTGSSIPYSGNLVNTVAWAIGSQVQYAVEGSIFIGGSAVQWLRDGLHLFDKAEKTEGLATSITSNDNVYFVPALTGLGAPYWDPHAEGLITGITRGTTAAHLARAALEAMAYQTQDVIEEIRRIMPYHEFETLRVDGGAVSNDFLMQFQADIAKLHVERPVITETTAFGAAGMAGISAGFWTLLEFENIRKIDKVFSPHMRENDRRKYYDGWKKAIKKSLSIPSGG